MAIDYSQTAKELVAALGGNENINNVTHCATRLRFILKDHSVVDKETASKIKNLAQTKMSNLTSNIKEMYSTLSRGQTGAKGPGYQNRQAICRV